MRQFSAKLIGQLDLHKAVRDEAAAVRNLVPTEPGWDKVSHSSPQLERWIRTILRAGHSPVTQHITNARKAQGVRPVPIWGIVERIVYRALTDLILGKDFHLDRSPEAYIDFVKAPVVYSEELQRARNSEADSKIFFFFLSSEIEYVVKSDIVAFYQYVDHSILGEELRSRGGDFDAIERLLELLAETQGRTFGLPQLLESSDHLSDVYIDRVERRLLRHGFATWRFNDDFRIACRTYDEALSAVEELDTSAREVGLVLSDSKTLTYGFVNYMSDSLNLEPQSNAAVILLADVEAAVGDYTDDFSEDPESAKTFIQGARLGESPDTTVNLRRISPENLRMLRRAVHSLAAEGDGSILPEVTRLFTYAPGLTPSLISYLMEMASTDTAGVETVLGEIILSVTMNEWQRQWVIQALLDLPPATDGSPLFEQRASWLESVLHESRSPITRAYIVRALAASGRITFEQVMHEFEEAPGALLPWYTEAFSLAASTGQQPASPKAIAALSRISPLHKGLLEP